MHAWLSRGAAAQQFRYADLLGDVVLEATLKGSPCCALSHQACTGGGGQKGNLPFALHPKLCVMVSVKFCLMFFKVAGNLCNVF